MPAPLSQYLFDILAGLVADRNHISRIDAGDARFLRPLRRAVRQTSRFVDDRYEFKLASMAECKLSGLGVRASTPCCIDDEQCTFTCL